MPPLCDTLYKEYSFYYVRRRPLSVWWLVWFVLSFILLGTTAWSLIILHQQKRAWSTYAKKVGLVFNRGRFSEPCSMEGTLNEFNVSFFSAVQQKEDSRKNRQLTVMQFILPKPFIDALAVGTNEMLPFLNSMEELTPHAVESDKWNSKANHMYSRNKASVDLFLTPERILILSNILKLANSDNIILLNPEEGLFRFETSNPLTEVEMIEKLVVKLMTLIKKLQPSPEEFSSFTKAMNTETKEVENNVSDEATAEVKVSEEVPTDKT